MTNLKKILTAGTALVALLGAAGTANAAITAGTAIAYVSGSTTPTTTTAFAGPTSLVLDGGGTGWSSAFIAGNTVTFTLSQGTFAVLPTLTPTVTAATAAYSSGGAGQNFVTYQLGGTVGATTVLTLTNVSVNGVTSVANGSTIRVTVTDGAGALVAALPSASDRRFNVASFTDPYTITLTTAGNTLVDLSATNPGAVYTSGSNSLGTITITPAASALVNWAGGNVTSALTSSSLTLTIPTGPFVSAVLGGSGSCTTATTVTSASNGVVTFTTGLTGINAPGAGACTIVPTLTSPGTTATALLGTGSASASVTVALGGVSSSNVTGTTRTLSQALTAVDYSGGATVAAGYVTGESTGYGYYISVTSGSTPGPVIVSATQGGATGTAVIDSAIPANTNKLYSIADIKAALITAGMAGTTFTDETSRGTLRVVVPTGARVAPLLLNKVNGQVVELSRRTSTDAN